MLYVRILKASTKFQRVCFILVSVQKLKMQELTQAKNRCHKSVQDLVEIRFIKR